MRFDLRWYNSHLIPQDIFQTRLREPVKSEVTVCWQLAVPGGRQQPVPWDKMEEWTGLRDGNFVADDMLAARHDLMSQGVSPKVTLTTQGKITRLACQGCVIRLGRSTRIYSRSGPPTWVSTTQALALRPHT